MKCIQATKDNNSYKKGYIARVEDKEADLKVSTGSWNFVSKSLWKSEKKGEVSEVVVEEKPKKKKSKKQD
jgi:hypothetical protein